MRFALPFFLLSLLFMTGALLPAASPNDTPRVMIFPPDHLTDEQRMFQGIPGLDGAPNGRLWAIWYGGGEGEDENNVVMLATSGDQGETWSEVKLVIDAPAPVRCFDPVVWVDPAGRLWVFWAQAVSHGIDAVTWAMVTDNPGDENPVWHRPFIVAPGVMMNKPTVLESGAWLLPVSDWEGRRNRTPGVPTAGVVISKDHGVTFEPLGSVLVPVEHRQYDEHMVVERRDGSLWMWLRTRYGMGEAFSSDGGSTWSELKPSPVEHVVSRFFIRRLQSGNLLLVKHGGIDEKPERRSHLTAFLSKDDGVVWEGRLLLDERVGVSYPDGFQDSGGTIHIIYDYSRRDAKEILMARFTEDDVLAGRAVGPATRKRLLVNKATGGRPVEPLGLRDNQDGEPLLRGPAAGWEFPRGKVEDLQLNTLLFSDRNYTLASLPEIPPGSRFLRGPLAETEAVCTSGGLVYLLTPSEGRNRHSLHQELLDRGFSKARVPEFLLFEHRNRASNLCSVYQKKVNPGDRLKLGTWGILVMPPAGNPEE